MLDSRRDIQVVILGSVFLVHLPSNISEHIDRFIGHSRNRNSTSSYIHDDIDKVAIKEFDLLCVRLYCNRYGNCLGGRVSIDYELLADSGDEHYIQTKQIFEKTLVHKDQGILFEL